MTIAVTGATGHLGALIVKHLLEAVPATQVVAIVRSPDRAAGLAERGVDVRQSDYDDRESLEKALAGVDRLVLVSSSEIGKRDVQHANVIEAAKTAGVGWIAYTSVLRVDKPGIILPIAPDHIVTEGLLAKSGIPHVLLRNGWYTENFLDTARQAAAIGILPTAASAGLVASAPRDDYAHAAAAVAASNSVETAIYELSGDTGWSQAEFAATITDITGAPVAVRPLTTDELAERLKAAGLPEIAIQFAVGIDVAIAAGELDVDPSHDLSRLIGQPTTPLADVLKSELGGPLGEATGRTGGHAIAS